MVLHKVSPLLKSQSNLPFFFPEVVSIGPYYNYNTDGHKVHNQLAAMEPYKIKVSAQYGDEARKKVHKLLAEEETRPMYEGGPYAGMDPGAFEEMLFNDACFIIHFISTVGQNPDDSVSRTSSQSREALPSVDMHLQGYVIRDLFLLENQLPYEVLKVVMPKGFEKELQKFICNVSHDYNGAGIMNNDTTVVNVRAAGQRREPEHLLDMLHQKLVGRGGGGDKRSGPGKDRWDSLKFRSVKELSEKGIKFLPSTTCRLTDVQYKEGCFRDAVTLPRMVVDDSTKSKFLNLMALEMCPGGVRRYDITSYICLLDNLIDHALDVSELRARGVLVNCLGSDQQVADLFNELATNRTPDPGAYVGIITGIHAHLDSAYKAHLASAYNTHFSTPWSMIATLAAALGLFFSAVQAWYSAKQ